MIHAAQEGTTVILQNADQCDANLSALLNEFSDQTGVQTRINVYASYPDEQGFPLHYDTHDVFIIQAEGSKRWRIFPPTIEYPLFYQKHHGIHRPDESALYLDCVLTSGDVLYIPRGHWHEAVAHADASLHLTLAVFAQTGIDFLSWLVDELRDDVRFRASLPLVLKDATTGYEASSNESIQQLQRLQSALLETLQDAPRLLDAFRSHCVAMQTLRRPFSFPHHFIDDPLPTGSHISFARPTRPSRLVTSNDQESIELIGAGQGLIRFGYQAKSLLEYVFSKSCFTIEELLDRF
jgi:ribosomal protein L16 Arg81 hydroxylase